MRGFEDEARVAYPVIAESDNFILLDLSHPK